MRTCCHCGTLKSPCWRRGPPDKPLLCNACGAHYLVKKSLDSYMPGQRASSPSSPSSPASTHPGPTTQGSAAQGSPPHRQRSRHARPHRQQQDQQAQSVESVLAAAPTPGPAPAPAAGDLMPQSSTCAPAPSCSAASLGSTSMERDSMEVEHPAVVSSSSRKKSRLVACSVYEVNPYTESVLRCKRTFEAPDGCMVTVVRRMRKQLKPRASCSS